VGADALVTIDNDPGQTIRLTRHWQCDDHNCGRFPPRILRLDAIGTIESLRDTAFIVMRATDPPPGLASGRSCDARRG
jgi:hypothetical protein